MNKIRLLFVKDRDFNDLRYTIDSSKLKELGWKESVGWIDGLKETIDGTKKIIQLGRYIE